MKRKLYDKVLDVCESHNLKIITGIEDFYKQHENVRRVEFICRCGKIGVRSSNYLKISPHCGCEKPKKKGTNNAIRKQNNLWDKLLNTASKINTVIISKRKSYNKGTDIIEFKCGICGSNSSKQFENLIKNPHCGCYFNIKNFIKLNKKCIDNNIVILKYILRNFDRSKVECLCHCGVNFTKGVYALSVNTHCGCEFDSNEYLSKSCTLYILESKFHNKIKIGYAQYLDNRIKDIKKQVKDASLIYYILTSLKDAKRIETHIHNKYKNYRRPLDFVGNGSSEWFEYSIISSVRDDLKIGTKFNDHPEKEYTQVSGSGEHLILDY